MGFARAIGECFFGAYWSTARYATTAAIEFVLAFLGWWAVRAVLQFLYLASHYTWVVGTAVSKFAKGESTGQQVKEAIDGKKGDEIAWTGPEGMRSFTKEYIQDEARSRSCGVDENMAPRDLLVRKDGAVGRLERADVQGGSRVTKHGSVYHFESVSGCSHRHLKADLDATLDANKIGKNRACAAPPRKLPDDGTKLVHIPASAVIDRGRVLNTADLARVSPGRRAQVGAAPCASCSIGHGSGLYEPTSWSP